MPVNIQDFINLLAELFEDRNLKCAVVESFKGGLLTGASAIIGGLLLGPLGLAVGGAIGGGVSAVSAKKKFKPVPIILRDMTPAQKELLYERVKHAFRDFGPQDVATLSMLLLSQASLTELAIRETLNFLRNDMLMTVQG